MAGKKKFGTFAGVFTPSILTILGVIMYMRLGWVVGNAGLIGSIIIILIAHVIAVSTGLSVSSIATDKKIGAGGIYYVLSRSMGIPIGGSIGIALYVGTAFSIALYLIGFAESFNGYFELATSINALRLTGTISLVLLTILALISTSVALKAQFFILAAIILSLISIFFGTTEFAPQEVELFSTEGAISMEIVFAIFFPAVTGFTAGIAMSGDLKDPKKSIPVGTLLAIGVGLMVYVGLAIFLAYNINTELLRSDYNILMRMAYFAPAVVAGIWGATLSSALGGILGGPRILQAMSIDKVTPKIFGKGKGKNNEPVNALFLVFIIAEAGILIGELDVIARVVSMFYLTAYGFINISYFLESWANPDFQPSFKIKRWIGLVGFIACFAVMFKLDMIAMFGAFAIVAGLYLWLQRKQIQLQSNDVWQSVWSNVVNKGLKRLEAKENSNSNWNPNILLFSDDSPHRVKLLELSKMVSGRTGIVTDFKLVEPNNNLTFSKNEQSYKDEILEELGIYGRKVEVKDPYSGVENIASTYGFTGVEPNTVMMNWSRTTKDPVKYVAMIQKLIHLDYNLLYLDYDERFHFGNYETIDLWWRETDSNNAEMMLNISRYISQSPQWAKAKIRILFVNHNNADTTLIKSKILKLVKQMRIDAKIKIINNGVEQKSFYEIIELQSAKTDLILLGIPNIAAEKQADFILTTDQLFETVGTTLLVKASNDFNVLDLDFVQREAFVTQEESILEPLHSSKNQWLNDAVYQLDYQLSESTKHLAKPTFETLSTSYYQWIDDIKKAFEKTTDSLDKNHSVNIVAREIQIFLNHIISSSLHFKNNKLPEIEELFNLGINSFLKERTELLKTIPKRVKTKTTKKQSFSLFNKEDQINWQEIVEYYHRAKLIPNIKYAFAELGIRNFIILNNLAEGVKEEARLFVEKIKKDKTTQEHSIQEFATNVNNLLEDLLGYCAQLNSQTINRLNNYERGICNELIDNIETLDFYNNIVARKKVLNKKEIEQSEERVLDYSTIWSRNQLLAHNQLQADLSLSNAGLSVFMVDEMIRLRISRLTIRPQQKEIKLFTEAINYIREHLGDEKLHNYSNKTLNKLIEGIPHIDFNSILKNEEDRILAISGKVPEHIHLMSADSFNDFQNYESVDVEEIEVSLANIQNYIIQSSYLSPLQDSLHRLEKVFKENTEELYNSSNLVKHILSEPLTEDNKESYKDNLLEVQKRMSNCLTQLKKVEASFNYDLTVQMYNTLTSLNIRTIIESIDSYAKVSSQPIIQTKFQKWFEQQKKIATQNYNNVYDFILQRQRDVDSIKFIEKHTSYLNHIELTNQFVNALGYNQGVENELSFYYKKLFTGSHLANLNILYKNKQLTAAKNAVARIDSGVSAAMMILGESLSGKTYFIESISNTIIKGEKVFINPPLKQHFDASDIRKALQNTFAKKGSAESILNQINHKTILIFDGLEKWWVKAPNGNKAINYLAELIEKFGNKHYFLLSCNIFSFDIIRKVSTLEKQLLATIIVPPASKSELKEILWNRHRTAGAELW
ncbi:MAG TPA: amino acid permease, partial [Saprospiraceae bacterium]|nr:amino acid permease [Saprospiraceae bacterium]